MTRISKTKKSQRRAVYPGSFDPITLGHIDIIQRISKLYDQVIVLVSQSSDKKGLFAVDERVQMIREELKSLRNVKVDSHEGLTVEYVKKVKAQVIVRGLRAVVDYEYELGMANVNKKLAPAIETVLVFANPMYYFVSSRMVKEVAKNKGSLKSLLSVKVAKELTKKLSEE